MSGTEPSIGDNDRIRATAETEQSGHAGARGTPLWYTTPSITGVNLHRILGSRLGVQRWARWRGRCVVRTRAGGVRGSRHPAPRCESAIGDSFGQRTANGIRCRPVAPPMPDPSSVTAVLQLRADTPLAWSRCLLDHGRRDDVAARAEQLRDSDDDHGQKQEGWGAVRRLPPPCRMRIAATRRPNDGDPMIWAVLVFLESRCGCCAIGIFTLIYRNNELRHRPGNVPVRRHLPGRSGGRVVMAFGSAMCSPSVAVQRRGRRACSTPGA